MSDAGVVVAGGGERNGIEGIVVGILIGSPDGKFGNGGSAILGIAGTVGKLGSGGSCVAGLGRDGWLGCLASLAMWVVAMLGEEAKVAVLLQV
ncbi:unnamed protein product [Prunus armeniaca]|uniref:Uncharacterized protein n=1 Tax=Prunus armeniaca TaxID=36596 RepID=A0A6J5Y8B7_PRUAR|nr:unnamed protein product [Prunus armeniaca]